MQQIFIKIVQKEYKIANMNNEKALIGNFGPSLCTFGASVGAGGGGKPLNINSVKASLRIYFLFFAPLRHKRVKREQNIQSWALPVFFNFFTN